MTPSALLRRLVLVKDGEAAALLWSAGYFFCLLFAYYLLRPFRDEMGIRGDLKNLPWLWTGTTAAMLVAAPLFALLVSRLPRRRFIPLTYHFFAANLLIFFALFMAYPAKGNLAIGYAFYIWLSVFNLFAVSVFWGFMADVWSTEQGKRLFGAIGIGGTLGAICGSSVPAALVQLVQDVPIVGSWTISLKPVHLLLVSVVFLEIAVQCVRRLIRLFGLDRPRPRIDAAACPNCGAALPDAQGVQGQPVCPKCGLAVAPPPSTPESPRRDAPPRASAEPGRGVFTGFLLIARSPYLLTICLYMLMFTVTSTFLWFEQARIVKASFTESSDRVSFLATMDLLVNVLTLVTQLFVTGRLLTRLGVTAGLLLLPIVTGTGFALLWAMPGPWMLMAVQVSRRGLHYAVDRPTREVLYTVLGPEEKYKSKSFIDTFVYRGGDLLGAWADHLLSKAGLAVAGIAIGVAAVWGTAGLTLGWMQRRLAARQRSAAAAPLPVPAAAS